MKRYILLAIVFLLLIELVRRTGNTIDCYFGLRYSPFLIGTDGLFAECLRRHILFPFGL